MVFIKGCSLIRTQFLRFIAFGECTSGLKGHDLTVQTPEGVREMKACGEGRGGEGRVAVAAVQN